MKQIQYQTQGTCSQMIEVTADENDIIQDVYFEGGCNGNLQGICQLVRGQRIDDVIRKLNGQDNLCAYFTADAEIDIDALREKGAHEGDSVVIGEMEFDFVE